MSLALPNPGLSGNVRHTMKLFKNSFFPTFLIHSHFLKYQSVVTVKRERGTNWLMIFSSEFTWSLSLSQVH